MTIITLFYVLIFFIKKQKGESAMGNNMKDTNNV